MPVLRRNRIYPSCDLGAVRHGGQTTTQRCAVPTGAMPMSRQMVRYGPGVVMTVIGKTDPRLLRDLRRAAALPMTDDEVRRQRDSYVRSEQSWPRDCPYR